MEAKFKKLVNPTIALGIEAMFLYERLLLRGETADSDMTPELDHVYKMAYSVGLQSPINVSSPFSKYHELNEYFELGREYTRQRMLSIRRGK